MRQGSTRGPPVDPGWTGVDDEYRRAAAPVVRIVLYRLANRDNHEYALSRFRLMWGARSFELDEGRILFGRGEECELRTEDPLVSRQHARFIVNNEAVMVEDLGSRNGVTVNGVKIIQVQVLKPEDRIRIGNQELTVLKGRDTGTWQEAPAPTQRFEGFGVIAELVEKAIALARVDEAERLVEGPFAQLLEELSSGRDIPAALVVNATNLAVKLAAVTSKRVWVERLIRLYRELKRPWPADTIEALYETARRVSGVNRALLKAYVTELQKAQLGPADRFLVRRIEGLERQFPIP